MVEAAGRPGVCVRDVAQQHGVCVSLIYRWRRASAPRAPASLVRSTVDAPNSGRTPAGHPLEFMPIGVFGRAEDEGPALVTGPPVGAAPPASGPPTAPRLAMEARPGLIEIDLADGTRLRVDAFVNERALRRVLAVLKASA
ncbi:MAG: hypothetical protein NVSMB18_37240 [Acetobacteraceae bacterium]